MRVSGVDMAPKETVVEIWVRMMVNGGGKYDYEMAMVSDTEE